MGKILKRKIAKILEDYYANDPGKILLVDGARQTGKSFIIRQTASQRFRNYIEVNLFEDRLGAGIFAGVDTVEKFNIAVSLAAGNIGDATKENTIVFLDEIQEYPQLLPLLKFINQEGRYRYIGSGSALGVELARTSSIPMGSIDVVRLHPLDFEEYLWANGVGEDVISYLRKCFYGDMAVNENIHMTIMRHFRMYLAVGGLPEAVAMHVDGASITQIRTVHAQIRGFYGADCAKYDSEHRLQIMRIYSMLPSFMEQRKKRVVYKKIDPRSARSDRYADEFDYLIASGVALGVQAVTNPVFPLDASVTKNLIKLYLNDVGLLSSVLFGPNLKAIMDDAKSINLGSLYETAVAMELSAHGHTLFYYDNRSKGEVDFLLNDYDTLSILPVEVKSGRDYQIHSSLTNMLNDGQCASRAVVLSNSHKYSRRDGVAYMPVYNVMFIGGVHEYRS